MSYFCKFSRNTVPSNYQRNLLLRQQRNQITHYARRKKLLTIGIGSTNSQERIALFTIRNSYIFFKVIQCVFRCQIPNHIRESNQKGFKQFRCKAIADIMPCPSENPNINEYGHVLKHQKTWTQRLYGSPETGLQSGF